MDLVLKDLASAVDSPAWSSRVHDANTISQHASDHAKSVLTRAFILAAALVVFIFVCAFFYRRLARIEPIKKQ